MPHAVDACLLFFPARACVLVVRARRFTAEDVGTIDSGLNSMVMASNNEEVLLPVNEPTSGGKRKSQILTYLEQNGGPGVQHIALKTDDIFASVSAMRAAHAACGGFELMDRPRDQYYDKLEARLGKGVLSASMAEQKSRDRSTTTNSINMVQLSGEDPIVPARPG